MMLAVIIFAVVLAVALAALLLLRDEGGPDQPRVRRCPLCGAELGTGESVIAQVLTQKPPQQIKIKGCRHCLPHYRDIPPEN